MLRPLLQLWGEFSDLEGYSMRKLALVIGMALLFAMAAFAQTGSISGTVMDPTGQVIPGAIVKLTFELNGEERSGTTSEVGDFNFPALVPGEYTIRVDAPGFRPLERKHNVVLAAGRLALGSLQLEVGSLSESVTVSAQGQAVATTTTAGTAVLDSHQVSMISIKGRDPISFLRILPGVQQGVDPDTFGGSFATAVPAIMGQTNRQTLYVDGINGGDGGNGGGGGGNFSSATNVDAIAEINVQLNSYTAEYGLKGGPQVNIVTKHGGAQFHGTAYWYKRHEMWNAKNFFNNKLNQVKPVYRYSTLGGNLGGPVKLKIPVINPDGNKFFFFYSIDDTRLKDVNQLRTYYVPTELERTGDFSKTFTTAGALIPIRDPLKTGNCTATDRTACFTDNKIPTGRISQQGLALLNIIPLPNVIGPASLGYNYVTQEPSIPHPRRQQIWRWDLRPTDKDSISIKYQTFWTKSVGWEVAGRSSPWGLVRQRYDFTSDDGKVDYTKVLSPNLVNELGIGIHYTTEYGPPEDDKALAGIQRTSFPALASLPQLAPINNPLRLIPKVTFGTLQSSRNSGLGQSDTPNIAYDGRWPITGADTSMPITDNLTYNRGVHTFKLGIIREFERFGQARSGTFAGEFNFSNDGNDPTNTGFAYANALAGHVTSYTESLGRVPDNFYPTTWSWYAQDTWKVRRNLTLDVGLRMYKLGQALWGNGETSEFSFERFNPTWGGKPPVLFRPFCVGASPCSGTNRRAQNPITNDLLPSTYIGLIVPGTGYSCSGAITPTTPCKINGVVTQNDPSYTSTGKGFYEPLGLQYDPRIGVAWDPFGDHKTAIRASVGAFHQGTGGFVVQGGGPAFRFDQVIRYTDMSSYFTGNGVTAPNVNVTGAWREGQKQPVTYNYTVGIQREIGWNTVLDVAYVGTTTHHLPQSWNFNALPAGVRFRPENRDTTVSASAANPGALPDAFLRPIIGFGDINIQGPATSARYDSLQVQANRRFTRGVELASSFTWASGMTNGWNQNNPLPSSAARQRNDLIQKLVLNFSYIIDLPKGSRLIPGPVSRAVLDNWQISGISTFATGRPSNVTAAYTDNFDFSGGGETCSPSNGAPIIQTGSAVLPRDQRTVDRWFDTSVFQRPSGRGDIGNNCNTAKFILPGFNNHDLSVFKNFPIGEGRKQFQFRAEAYNALNHTQFNAVDTAAQFDATGKQTKATFGQVTSAKDGRRLQFSLRFMF
jgi:hypothetical protein